ncbi:MAG: CoA-binding protein [Planctomycetes bacterium]|nr:CoA-binding protein [Planctomycetota bacterium]
MTSIAEILKQSKSVAIVGYSAKPDRASHWISDYLEEHGYQVFRINPVMESSTEIPIYPSVADLPQQVDIIDVFRAPPHLPAIVEAAVATHAKVVWMQPGAENPEAAMTATDAGLIAIVGNCIYREHKALFGIEDDRGHTP